MTVLVVDPSAAVALIENEPGWEALALRLHAVASRVLSVAGWVELSLVVAGRHGDGATLEFRPITSTKCTTSARGTTGRARASWYGIEVEDGGIHALMDSGYPIDFDCFPQ